MADDPQEAAVAEPAVSEAKTPVSEAEVEDIQPGVEIEPSPEHVPEAEPEPEAEAEPEAEPVEEDADATIDSLPQEVVDRIIDRRGGEHIAEREKRARQSATDTLTAEQQQTAARQADTERVFQMGREAMTNMSRLLEEAAKSSENGEPASLNREELFKNVNQYRDAWVTGQSQAWNQELQQVFLGNEAFTASLTEQDMAAITEGVRQTNRTGNRLPMLQAMFDCRDRRMFDFGCLYTEENIKKMAEQGKVVEGKKGALQKLKARTPTPAPVGGSAQTAAQKDIISRAAAGEDVDSKKLQAALDALE